MTPYSVETMSRRELRKCYNRYCWAVILLFPVTLLTAALLIRVCTLTAPQLFSDPTWRVAIPALVNAVSSYLPTAVILLLLLGRFPRSEKLPVDRLDLWEFLQALVFTLGVCYLFNLLTIGLIELMQSRTGLETFNRIDLHDAASPIWEQVIFSVLIPPVCEELLFRRLLLDRLRPLGDVSAVYLSALAFSLFHGNLYQMLYTFVLGVFFAMLVLLTGSVRDTILLHMCINGMTTLNYVFPGEWFAILRTVLYPLCAALAIAMYVKQRSHFRLESGPLSLSPRDKRRACLGSVWFYVMLLSCLYVSIAIIFR